MSTYDSGTYDTGLYDPSGGGGGGGAPPAYVPSPGTAVSLPARLPVSHRTTTRLTLLTKGNPVLALPGPLVAANSSGSASSVTGGTIAMDTTSTVGRTATFSIVDPTGQLVPGISAFLEPAGNEVLIEYGVDLGNGVFTYYPAATVGIVTADVVDTLPSGTTTGSTAGTVGPVMTLTCSDRSQVIGASSVVSTYQTADGIDTTTAIYQLISQAVPWLPGFAYRLQTTGFPLPSQIVAVGANPWTTAQGWAASAGYRLYIDASAHIVLEPAVPAGVPVRVYARGVGQILAGISLAWDASQAFNGVTVIGSYPGSIPVQATAWDVNPGSPTYYLGPFGPRPAPPLTSSTAQTVSQCLAAAQALLPSVLGLSRSLTITTIPDPTVREYDTVIVNSPQDGVSGMWQVRSFTLPLDYTALMAQVLVPVTPGLLL